MVKVKNKKRNTAEFVNDKKAFKSKKVLNPFEVHINKEKIRVLGKRAKNDRGLPGVARAKAIQKRKNTILPEYKVKDKSNQFTDRRIGEKNRSLTAEDKSLARYTAVRVKQHKKKSIYNLADDEVLTHKGQTLSEIEKFDDVPYSDDDDDDNRNGKKNSGNLDSNFVEDAHFGGGMLKKADGSKSHKDIIEQLIADSKKRKAEMQKQKEANSDLTDKLDSEWKDLLPIVTKKSKTEDSEAPAAKVDDYDKVMRELKFEARGIPSDKLKTEDEIAKEEKDKLERLERERLERMKGNLQETTSNKISHRSADDLDDNFAYDSDTPDVTLSYNDGKSNIQQKEDKENIEQVSEESENEDGEEEESEEDNLSDLKDDEEESSDEDVDNERNVGEEKEESSAEDVKEVKTNGKHQLEDAPLEAEESKTENSVKIKEDLLQRKEMMEQARKELPYTFDLPESYKKLQELLKEKPSHHQGVIIERMIKCNHPSLKEGNKDELSNLFAYLLQHLSDICCDIEEQKDVKNCFDIFSCLAPQFFDLAQLNPENAHRSLIEVIKELHESYRRKTKRFPNLELILYLKLVSCLFSTSDFRHLVVTPCIIFMEQMLTLVKIKTRAQVAYGLFLVSLLAEYTTLSKRYSPASIKFLCSIMNMAVQKKQLPPFRPTSPLLLPSKPVDDIDNLRLDITDLIDTQEIDNNFKIKAMNVTLELLNYFHENYKTLPSVTQIFATALKLIVLLPKQNYPQSLTEYIEASTKSLEYSRDNSAMEYVAMEKKKPKALRLYEPNIVKIFDRKMHKSQSKEKAERDKLLHKIKKEKKGAMREIRRDKAFLGRFKINQKIKSDLVRKDKVKKIYSEAASQQCALNAMDRYNDVRKGKKR